VVRAFFPLDEELALVPGQLTPLLAESLARLSSWMPFAPAAEMLAFFTQTSVSTSSARRVALAVGTAAVALVEAAAAAPLAQRPVPATEQPARLYVGVDGAFVRLVGADTWVEVKTLAIGEVGLPVLEAGELVVHTSALSYFSSVREADEFIVLSQVELARRRVADAQELFGVSDGARWIQRLFDTNCPHAERILDLPHAVGYLAQAGTAFYRQEPAAFPAWFAQQRQTLKTGDPRQVVAELHRLSLAAYDQNVPEAVQTVIDTAHDYLTSRLRMIAYASFQAAGKPLGSGASESANKLVVERRLKGSGMHWQRASLDPMLALLTTTATQRWADVWPATAAQRRTARYQRLLDRHAPPPPTPPTPPPPAPKAPARPAKDHPWRRQPIGRQRAQPSPALAPKF
jgi:hypothetical protein